MASNLARVSEPFADEDNETAQQQRPSVTWNLSLPTVSTAAIQTTRSSGSYSASAFLWRHRFGSRPEINLGTQPRIIFLRPQTSQPLVLFRCGRGARSDRQTPCAPDSSAGPGGPGCLAGSGSFLDRRRVGIPHGPGPQLLPRSALPTAGSPSPLSPDSGEKPEIPPATHTPIRLNLAGMTSRSPGVPSARGAEP